MLLRSGPERPFPIPLPTVDACPGHCSNTLQHTRKRRPPDSVLPPSGVSGRPSSSSGNSRREIFSGKYSYAKKDPCPGRAGIGKTAAAISLGKEILGRDFESNFTEINASDDLEFLDVPAFLRRQAD